MRSLDNPAASRTALAAFRVEFFLTDPPDVWRVVRGSNHSVAGWVVVSLIQTQMLRVFLGGLRSVHHDRLDGLLQQLGVVHLGTSQRDSQRPAIGLDD
jgi:hypothetical protein